MRTTLTIFAALLCGPLSAQESNAAVDKLLDRIIAREQVFLSSLRAHTPLFETYIQETGDPTATDARPTRDHYFLGRAHVGASIEYEPLIARSTPETPEKSGGLFGRFQKPKTEPLTFLPRGFVQMAIPDLNGFNRQNYRFEYVRREFVGDVRCLVFDVSPVRGEPGRFLGRIWVEDKDNSIVRFNGTYVPTPPAKNAPPELYFHFDSWRVNPSGNEWVPAQIYIEEESAGGVTRFKAQTRAWDFAAAPANKLDELTQILIDNGNDIDDSAARRDASPLESQRAWERQAEDNVISRLEKGGLIAPPGPVDEVLNTVLNNLIVSAGLNVDARARVLLTTPIETFSIGHTIVISRGLIDVLPDETSLALMLADELAHIALGHRTPTQFAFSNQTMLSDAELLDKFHFDRTPEELDEAGIKTIAMMKASPYTKTSNAGLFLKALAARSAALPRLLAANLGNQVANESALARLADFTAQAPEIEDAKLEQIAALPLGSRVKLNPYDDRIELVETKPIALLSAREKMPFEVTPFLLYLTRAAEPKLNAKQ